MDKSRAFSAETLKKYLPKGAGSIVSFGVKGGRDAGKAFIDWALSKPTQDFLVAEMGRRPARADGAVPPGLPALGDLKLLPYDFDWAADHKQELVARWTGLVTGH